MYSKKQSRQREQIERDRRAEIIHKIKCQGIRKRTKNPKTFSNVGYVLGRYNPNTCTYEYSCPAGFTRLLTSATIANKAEDLHSPKDISERHKIKGCKYSISKVFYKTITLDDEDRYINYIETVTLTKPNHYEMLSAVINNI